MILVLPNDFVFMSNSFSYSTTLLTSKQENPSNALQFPTKSKTITAPRGSPFCRRKLPISRTIGQNTRKLGLGVRAQKNRQIIKGLKVACPIHSNRGLPSAPDGLFPLAGFSASDVTIQFVGNPNFLGTVRNPFSCKTPSPPTLSRYYFETHKDSIVHNGWGKLEFPFLYI